MSVEIRGTDLPGRRCGPAPEGSFYENIHVGVARGANTIDLVPGDADSPAGHRLVGQRLTHRRSGVRVRA